ncbi:hypothetical protein IMY05_C4703000300 [Salix suchowensis]|nr:hypothetical protein IMY05_C4703000300 [Salix suchowensis]
MLRAGLAFNGECPPSLHVDSRLIRGTKVLARSLNPLAAFVMVEERSRYIVDRTPPQQTVADAVWYSMLWSALVLHVKGNLGFHGLHTMQIAPMCTSGPESVAPSGTGTPRASQSSGGGGGGTNAGAIAGGVVGGVVGLGIIAGVVFWLLRRRNAQRNTVVPVNPSSDPLTPPPMSYVGGSNMDYPTTPPPKLYDPSDPSTFPSSPANSGSNVYTTTSSPPPLAYHPQQPLLHQMPQPQAMNHAGRVCVLEKSILHTSRDVMVGRNYGHTALFAWEGLMELAPSIYSPAVRRGRYNNAVIPWSCLTRLPVIDSRRQKPKECSAAHQCPAYLGLLP